MSIAKSKSLTAHQRRQHIQRCLLLVGLLKLCVVCHRSLSRMLNLSMSRCSSFAGGAGLSDTKALHLHVSRDLRRQCHRQRRICTKAQAVALTEEKASSSSSSSVAAAAGAGVADQLHVDASSCAEQGCVSCRRGAASATVLRVEQALVPCEPGGQPEQGGAQQGHPAGTRTFC